MTIQSAAVTVLLAAPLLAGLLTLTIRTAGTVMVVLLFAVAFSPALSIA